MIEVVNCLCGDVVPREEWSGHLTTSPRAGNRHADASVAPEARRPRTTDERIAIAKEREQAIMRVTTMLNPQAQVVVDFLQQAAAIRVLKALILATGIVSPEELAASIAEARVQIIEESTRSVRAVEPNGSVKS